MNDILACFIGAIVSTFLGVVFSDQLKQIISNFYFRYLGKERTTLDGKWVATFEIEGEKKFTEIINIVQRGGFVVGHICDDARNYPELLQESKNEPLRVKGELYGNYLTGHWYHPLQRHRFHGSFQVRLLETGDMMEGMWIGFISNSKGIDAGNWVWKRDED